MRTAFESLYRLSSNDRRGQLVPLCNSIGIKRVSVYALVWSLVLGSTENRFEGYIATL